MRVLFLQHGRQRYQKKIEFCELLRPKLSERVIEKNNLGGGKTQVVGLRREAKRVCEREIGGGFGRRWQRGRGCHVVGCRKRSERVCRAEMKGSEAKSDGWNSDTRRTSTGPSSTPHCHCHIFN